MSSFSMPHVITNPDSLCHTSKQGFHFLEAIIENILDFPANCGGKQATQRTEGEEVTYAVKHFNASLDLPEMMLMVPDGVGPHPLFVNKKIPVGVCV